MVSRCNIKPGILSRIVNRALLMMKFAILVLALVLFTLSPVEGIKACKKIDTCRCLTDEGVINLWSLAGQTPKRARFNISATSVETYYQWNPCSQWKAQDHPCEDAAVCKVTQRKTSETSHLNIGEHDLSDCVLDERNGRCMLTYGVTGNSKIKTSIALVCDKTEQGKVDPMVSDASTYSASLHSICACPGRCSLEVTGDVGIRFDASSDGTGGLSIGAIVGIAIGGVVLLIILAFSIFICCLRRKLPSGIPKPSICTTVKVGLGIIKKKFCPCC